MSQWKAKALAPLTRWRPTGQTRPAGIPIIQVNVARLETVPIGSRCEWAIAGVYDHLGLVEVRNA